MTQEKLQNLLEQYPTPLRRETLDDDHDKIYDAEGRWLITLPKKFAELIVAAVNLLEAGDDCVQLAAHTSSPEAPQVVKYLEILESME